MDNYHFRVDSIPRKLRMPLVLKAFGSFEKIILNGKYQIGNNVEFGFRISSPDQYAEDYMDGKRYVTEFPHLFIKLPSVEYNAKPFSPRRGFYLIYDNRYMSALRLFGIRFDQPAIPLEVNESLMSHLRTINQLAENLYFPGNIDRIDCEALHCLQKVMLQIPEEKGPDNFYRQKINEIASYIHCRYKTRIDLGILLRKYGLSRRTFFRYWNQVFPVTPKKFQQHLRLNEAAKRLEHNESINSIALSLGFEDVSRFSRQFREFFDRTPTSYRKGLRTQESATPRDSWE